jgi:transaldolase/glucose-6-phosphate isomerase
LTPATLDAFRDHGQPRASLETDIERARRVIQTLKYVDISLERVTDRLLEDGIALFSKAFDSVLVAVDEGRRSTRAPVCHRQRHTVPHDDATKIIDVIADWEKSAKARRLWSGDATLWTGAEERDWLGWLTITDDQLAHIGPLKQVAQDVAAAFSHVVLLGMGGASLCADVMRRTFGTIMGFPELHVLDSIDPAQIKSIEDAVDLAHTVFIVSSKSGTTFETNILLEYFTKRVKGAVGDQHAGEHFIAITGPDSALHGVAVSERFRHVYFGMSSIGGRYSALSNFGMVPAAVMGVDVERLLDRADVMVHACAESVPTDENPVIILGAILGTLADDGRDKVTIVTSPRISGLGAWLEHLIAESSGRHSKALIPVDREQVGPPGVYGRDRVFVYVRLDSDPDPAHDSAIGTLERAGQPVMRIAIADTLDIGQEFFRWEMAIAVARSILGINPFNQPDVETSKIATRGLTSGFEKTGTLPHETPIFEQAGIALFADAQNTAALEQFLDGDRSIAGYLRAHLNRIRDGDYFAILTYLAMSQAHDDALQKMRHAVRDRKRIATCLGFGPRFLHSTDQVYARGPNTGVFLQITCDDAEDIPVPGQKYSFSEAKAAAALGDFTTLLERERRVLRVHLGPDVGAGLAALDTAFELAIREQAKRH